MKSYRLATSIFLVKQRSFFLLCILLCRSQCTVPNKVWYCWSTDGWYLVLSRLTRSLEAYIPFSFLTLSHSLHLWQLKWHAHDQTYIKCVTRTRKIAGQQKINHSGLWNLLHIIRNEKLPLWPPSPSLALTSQQFFAVIPIFRMIPNIILCAQAGKELYNAHRIIHNAIPNT